MCGYVKFQLIGWEDWIIVQEGMIRWEGMIGVIAEMQLGTNLIIYVINNLLAGTLYTHIKGAHEGLKYYCNDCDYKATHKGTLTTHIKAVHEGSIFVMMKQTVQLMNVS